MVCAETEATESFSIDATLGFFANASIACCGKRAANPLNTVE
jgi:hypothetical protein